MKQVFQNQTKSEDEDASNVPPVEDVILKRPKLLFSQAEYHLDKYLQDNFQKEIDSYFADDFVFSTKIHANNPENQKVDSKSVDIINYFSRAYDGKWAKSAKALSEAGLNKSVVGANLISRGEIVFTSIDITNLLSTKEMISDNIVNSYFSLVYKDHPSVVIHSTQFYNRLFKDFNIYCYENVSKWNIGGLNSEQLTVIPIHIGEYHWAVVCILFSDKSIYYLDSLLWNGKDILRIIFRWLFEAYLMMHGDILPGVDEWRLYSNGAGSKLQTGGNDCGIYAILFADHIVHGLPITPCKNTKFVSRYRIVIASRLMEFVAKCKRCVDLTDDDAPLLHTVTKDKVTDIPSLLLPTVIKDEGTSRVMKGTDVRPVSLLDSAPDFNNNDPFEWYKYYYERNIDPFDIVDSNEEDHKMYVAKYYRSKSAPFQNCSEEGRCFYIALANNLRNSYWYGDITYHYIVLHLKSYMRKNEENIKSIWGELTPAMMIKRGYTKWVNETVDSWGDEMSIICCSLMLNVKISILRNDRLDVYDPSITYPRLLPPRSNYAIIPLHSAFIVYNGFTHFYSLVPLDMSDSNDSDDHRLALSMDIPRKPMKNKFAQDSTQEYVNVIEEFTGALHVNTEVAVEAGVTEGLDIANYLNSVSTSDETPRFEEEDHLDSVSTDESTPRAVVVEDF